VEFVDTNFNLCKFSHCSSLSSWGKKYLGSVECLIFVIF